MNEEALLSVVATTIIVRKVTTKTITMSEEKAEIIITEITINVSEVITISTTMVMTTKHVIYHVNDITTLTSIISRGRHYQYKNNTTETSIEITIQTQVNITIIIKKQILLEVKHQVTMVVLAAINPQLSFLT